MLCCVFLAWSVLNYLLNNSTWGKGIVSGENKSEFFHTLLAVMLSMVWCLWNLSAFQGCWVQSACGRMSQVHRSWVQRVSVSLLDESPKTFPVSSFLFPSTLTCSCREKEVLLHLGWWAVEVYSFSRLQPSIPSRHQPAARHFIQVSPLHHHLGFTFACFRKHFAPSGDALDVSSILSRAELPNWVLSCAGEGREFGASTLIMRTQAISKRSFFVCWCLEQTQGLVINSVT